MSVQDRAVVFPDHTHGFFPQISDSEFCFEKLNEALLPCGLLTVPLSTFATPHLGLKWQQLHTV